MFEGEEWRPVNDPIANLDHYLVSTHGRVKREDSDEPRKVSVSDKGFPIVTLYGKDSKTRYLRQINALVAGAHLRPPIFENETAVWHIDGDLLNCHFSNLKWDTRSRVLDWNEMQRSGRPKYNTPRVKNNRTGQIYDNAYDCGMQEGKLEIEIINRVERQARHVEDDQARYRYILGD